MSIDEKSVENVYDVVVLEVPTRRILLTFPIILLGEIGFGLQICKGKALELSSIEEDQQSQHLEHRQRTVQAEGAAL